MQRREVERYPLRRAEVLRRQLALTQTEVARRLGTHRTIISAIERGRYVPRHGLLERLARFYRVEAGELLRRVK